MPLSAVTGGSRPLGGKYMVMQLAALGIYQSQAMIITQMLGPAQVVIFAVTYKVVALPVDLVYMGTVPFMAAFGEAKARRDWDWIKGAYKNATFVSIGLCLPLAAALALVAKPLILIWAGPSAAPSCSLAVCLYRGRGMSDDVGTTAYRRRAT